MSRPDYQSLRNRTRFNWHAGSSYYVLLSITGISLYDLNTDPEAAIELFKPENRNAVRDIFGEGAGIPYLTTPKISYGHINCLGFELRFPEKGEVNYVHMKKSLSEWTKLLTDTLNDDFSKCGLFPFYRNYREKLKAAYPKEIVGFGFGYEGPMTTAYEFRDMEAFTDPIDSPAEFCTFMEALTQNLVKYIKCCREIDGQSFKKSGSITLLDDLASVFSPDMWPDFVLPYWEKYFESLTFDIRRIHVEDLGPKHLFHLEDAGISSYDPGISHKLDPRIIQENTRVPFDWRMGSFHMKYLDISDISDWVYKAAADGASTVFTTIPSDITDKDMIEKVKLFIKTCREVEKILNNGGNRQELYKYVSPEGLEKFWDKWSYKNNMEG